MSVAPMSRQTIGATLRGYISQKSTENKTQALMGSIPC